MKASDAKAMADRHNRFKWLEDLIKEACGWGKYELWLNEEMHPLTDADLLWLQENGFLVEEKEDMIHEERIWRVGWRNFE
jgi:hypothetical protein